jgi:hypothetical protein
MYRRGLDIYITNPCNALGRPHVYSPLWVGSRGAADHESLEHADRARSRSRFFSYRWQRSRFRRKRATVGSFWIAKELVWWRIIATLGGVLLCFVLTSPVWCGGSADRAATAAQVAGA